MTPAITAAKRAGVRHSVHRYDHDPGAESYGMEAADKLHLDPARVFKTLVAAVTGAGGDGFAVALVPVAHSLDLKRLASALGAKKAEMAAVADAERITGYQVGGISPLGQKRRLKTVIDASASGQATIFVSAGRRGLQIELAPADLARLTNAISAPIATE